MPGDRKGYRRQIFVAEYLKDLNGAAAAIRAGYEKRSASVRAARLLARPDVQAQVKSAMDARAARTEITADKVLRELAKIGFANMADYMRAGQDGDPVLDFSAVDRDKAAALVEVTVEDFKDARGEESRDVRRVKFKLADKRAALVDLGKHLGLFVERREVTVKLDPDDYSDAELAEIVRRESGATDSGPTAGSDEPDRIH